MSTPTGPAGLGPAAAGVCAVCGAGLEPGSAFCGSCGARVPGAVGGWPARDRSSGGAGAGAAGALAVADGGRGAVDAGGGAAAAGRGAADVGRGLANAGRGAAAAGVAPLGSSRPGAPATAPAWSLGADVDDAVAPVWRRLVALLVDQALAVLVGSAGLLAVLPALRSDGSVGALLVPGLLLLLLAAGQWFAEAFGGRTVGGALLGTRTVSARTGRAPGLWAVLVRSVVQALGLLLGGIGVYVVAGSGAWDEGPEQRGWHDKAAGTLVLRARAPRREEPGPSAPPAPAPAPAPVARPAGPTSGPPRPASAAKPPTPPAPRSAPTSGPPQPAPTGTPETPSAVPARPVAPTSGPPAAAAAAPVPASSGPATPAPDAPAPEAIVRPSATAAPGEPLPAPADLAPEAAPITPTPAPQSPAQPASAALGAAADASPATAPTTEHPARAPGAPRHAAPTVPEATSATPGRVEPTPLASGPVEPSPLDPAPATPPPAGPRAAASTPGEPVTASIPSVDAASGLPDTTIPTADLGDLEHTRVGRWAGSLDAASSTLALVLDTGERVAVTGPGLVGRRPVPGTEQWAHLVTIDDPAQSVSSTHLAFWPVDGGLDVLDRGSTNGTVLLDAAGKPWSLPPGQPARVGAGWTLVLGSRRITVTPA